MAETHVLEPVEAWAEALLRSIKPAQRVRLARHMARVLRTQNVKRMRAQTDAEGQKWEPRKRPREANNPIRKLYLKKKDGDVRELEMSSWRHSGDRIIGYDKEAGGIRTMLDDNILADKPTKFPHTQGATRKARSEMFRRIRARLRTVATGNEAALMPDPKHLRIARVHHFGGADEVTRGGPIYDYPARPLIGFASEDEAHLREALAEYLLQAAGQAGR